ncbi:MAG: hypothetical protein H0T92_07760 [Pyrinomonadaceae bacterium]|nr:hypothetical protein [Pyrinomonadaceae bacterium]
MYCPRCSQQRALDNVQYCSQCGLPLDGVAALLAAGGKLPIHDMAGSEVQRSSKKKGVRQGATLLILGMMLTPLLAILHEVLGTPEGLIALSALIFFWGGILRIAYALIMERDATGTKQGIRSQNIPTFPAPVQVNSASSKAALPPSQSARVPSFKQGKTTAELVTPSSVTEHTTRLLNNDQPDGQAR